MNKIFTFLSTVEESERLESLLNTFRIGLNNWDKSKVFEVQGHKLINYTIVTNEETFRSLTTEMNAQRMY